MSQPKLAIVTGASSGIGLELAKLAAKDGFDLIVAADTPFVEAGPALKELGVAVEQIEADLSTEQGVKQLLDKVGDRPVDVLVANAGHGLGHGFLDQAPDEWRHVIDTNITGLVALTRALLPRLIERKGQIINLSSVAATYPYKGGAVYAGTKAFVRQFSLDLRCDLAGTGVRVTSIEPGMAETEFTIVRTGGDKEASDKLYAGMDPMTSEDLADLFWWVATLPPHLNINTVELMPVTQSWGGFTINREA